MENVYRNYQENNNYRLCLSANRIGIQIKVKSKKKLSPHSLFIPQNKSITFIHVHYYLYTGGFLSA